MKLKRATREPLVFILLDEQDIIITLYYRLTCAWRVAQRSGIREPEKGVVDRVLGGREEAEAAREKTLPNRMPI